MITALLVDDEPLARSRMRTLLREHEDFVVIAEAEDGAAALLEIESRSPDVVFLDVKMSDVDGLTVARRLTARDRPLVVFVTAYEEYALEAFRASAAHYLLKPVDPQALQLAVDRVRKLLDVPVQHVTVRQDGRTTLLRVDDIQWIEAAGNYVRFHLPRRRYLLRETMARLERKLNRRNFVRIHRSAIVNLAAVREFRVASHGDAIVVLSDGTELMLSRFYRDRVEALIGRV